MAKYGIVLVTAASQPEADTIAQRLIADQLAACVTILPVKSVYTWQGQVNQDQEWQLLIKTDLDQFDQVADAINALHSYDIPEIIAIPIVQGYQPYLDWIANQTSAS